MKLLDLMPVDTPRVVRLPATEDLLTNGGDVRISIGDNGLNRYGCRTVPDPQRFAFGSSTASTISEAGFLAADQLREKLQSQLGQSPDALYAIELERIRQELTTLCGLDDEFCPDMIFAASGTDLHLIAASLASRAENRPLQVIIAGADETGRGVPAAVTGRHFSTSSALGLPVVEGGACLTHGDIRLQTVSVRTAEGCIRSVSDVDDDIDMLVRKAVAAQHRVLLIVVDVSKTGIIAPSPACAIGLRDAFPDTVDLMVDACQFRIAPATLQGYLCHGFMVALTGSKFLTGPTFSGVLMIPPGVTQTMRRFPLPVSLAAYSCQPEWPASWSAAAALGRQTNFGLLLRWEAALAELRRFAVIPERRIKDILLRFSQEVTARLQNDPCFESLSLPALNRASVSTTMDWDSVPTIFPFIPCRIDRHGGRQPLSSRDTIRLYQRLHDGFDVNSSNRPTRIRLDIGQPVPCGTRQGVQLNALRLCMSARLVADAAVPGGEHLVINHAMQVLDEVARLTAEAH